jgi:hypothetical protein
MLKKDSVGTISVTKEGAPFSPLGPLIRFLRCRDKRDSPKKALKRIVKRSAQTEFDARVPLRNGSSCCCEQCVVQWLPFGHRKIGLHQTMDKQPCH